VDDFAPRLSFFFNSHSDFFEEIAKFRAARKVWAQVMRDRFHAKNERSLLCRFHTQTAGCSLTAQQPYNNVVRTALQALAAVLGGTQSLHTNSLDEAWALPTEEAALLALRTQQVIAYESGVTAVADPLGGSYFVEALTDELERQAYDYFARIDALGGMVAAVKANYPQREIADASFKLQRQIESGERILVGVNAFTDDGGERESEILRIDPDCERKQLGRLQAVRAARDAVEVEQTLTALRAAAAREEVNLMEPLLACAGARASEGEIIEALQDVFGTYSETPVF
jgi:methylmalonyl-CoA mutase N-terminal domain/subunit